MTASVRMAAGGLLLESVLKGGGTLGVVSAGKEGGNGNDGEE